MRILYLLLLTLSACASPSIAIAIGQGNSSGMREMTIASGESIWDNLRYRGSAGVWAGGPGLGAIYGSYQLGWAVDSGPVTLSLYSGPALISSTDQLLGSYLEFASEVHADFRNEDGYLGVFYRHMSDAGLTSINVGRDVVGLEIGL